MSFKAYWGAMFGTDTVEIVAEECAFMDVDAWLTEIECRRSMPACDAAHHKALRMICRVIPTLDTVKDAEIDARAERVTP